MKTFIQCLEFYPNFNLTKRELEITKLIITEYNNYEIADSLFLSPATVVTHRKNIFRKLNINSSLGLLGWALRNNLEMNLLE